MEMEKMEPAAEVAGSVDLGEVRETAAPRPLPPVGLVPVPQHMRRRSELDDAKSVIPRPEIFGLGGGDRTSRRSAGTGEARPRIEYAPSFHYILPSPPSPSSKLRASLRPINRLRACLRIGICFASAVSIGVCSNLLHSLAPASHWEIDPTSLDEAPILRLLCCSVFTLVVELVFLLASACSDNVRKADGKGTAIFESVAGMLMAGINAGIGGHALTELQRRPAGTVYEICNLSHPCKITALERPDYPFLCGEITTSIASLIIVSVFEFLIFPTILACFYVKSRFRRGPDDEDDL